MDIRGLYPSWTAWWVNENAPEMSAWEAMMAAAVARPTMGRSAQGGARRKNGCLAAVLSISSSAP